MKKFFLEGFYFCLPPFIFCLFIFCIDPYNYFNVSKVISNETKFVTLMRSPESMPRGSMLWNMLKFNRKPCRNVIIGNSQGFLFREKLIFELTGEEYYNFCVPGATVKSNISTFWYINKQIKPTRVIMQVSFALSNSSITQAGNLFKNAQDCIDRPYLYFLNKDILFDSYYNLKYEIIKKKGWPGQKAKLKLINGNNSVDESGLINLFKNYTYPEKDITDLKKVSDYCKKNNIKLEFIILPMYHRFDEFLFEKGLSEKYNRFRTDLSSLGNLHDYSNIKSINNNELNFSDYFHPNQHITDSLTPLIWHPKSESDSLDLK
jgi:hypothetical protein